MIDAFLYLTRTAITNRLRARARRLRSPRYALALVVGIAYFWFFFLRSAFTNDAGANVVRGSFQVIAVVAILGLLLSAWVFQSDRMALAFTPAEVQFLFPAPVTRRGLIIYKLFRTQLVILLNAAIWAVILHRSGGTLPVPLRFVGAWLLFSNLSLHRIGAALVRTSVFAHGRSGVRRHLPALIVGAAVVVALAWLVRDAVLLARSLHQDVSLASLAAAGTELLATPAGRGLLFVPRLMIAPTFAHSVQEWARAIGPALVVMSVQLAWVLMSDVAFEDAAVQASAERARRLVQRRSRATRPSGVPRSSSSPRRSLPLAPTGLPWIAILWKNALLFLRTGRMGPIVALAVVAVFVAGTIVPWSGAQRATVGTVALLLVLLLMVFGSRLLHNDFRQDVDHLETLKTLPITGAQLIRAEVLSSAVPVAIVQSGLVVFALMMLGGETLGSVGLPPASVPIFVALMPLALMAFNIATSTLQNGATLLFPGWTRVHATPGGGVEVMGQSILALGLLMLCTVVALIPPAIVGGAVAMVVGPGAWHGWAASVAAGTVALLVESWLASRSLGRRFERMEPQAR